MLLCCLHCLLCKCILLHDVSHTALSCIQEVQRCLNKQELALASAAVAPIRAALLPPLPPLPNLRLLQIAAFHSQSHLKH